MCSTMFHLPVPQLPQARKHVARNGFGFVCLVRTRIHADYFVYVVCRN